MHIVWKRRRLASNRQTGEFLCRHKRVRRPTTLTPVMHHYQDGQTRAVWRIGPSIRECCLDSDMVRASWWYEVGLRFDDLGRLGLDGLDPAIAILLLDQRGLIEQILRSVVPRPHHAAAARYRRTAGPRRHKPKPPAFVQVLGLSHWPVPPATLKAWWRQLALQHHPDRGGTASDFIRVKTAYEEALRSVS